MRGVPALIALALMLGGCGLRPLYEGGARSAAAQRLGGIVVEPIPGKAGWLVRNALVDRLGGMPEGQARYRLTIALDDEIEGLGVRANETVTRERRALRARYQLRSVTADAKAPPILDETASIDAGIDVASSEYATVAAEDSALERLATTLADRILARLAVAGADPAGQ